MKKTYLLSGICLLSFGLSACVSETSNDSMAISETTKTEIVTETELLATCNLDDSECTLTDDFLTDNFVMAGEDGTVALSRPASKGNISVKDKQKKDTVAQTTTSEKIETKKETPVVVLTKEVKTEETQVAKDATKIEVLKATETKAEAKETTKTTSSDVKVEQESKATENETISMSERLVPLKKIKTTITETTTRIQDDPTESKETKELLDKIHYGEEVHDWEATPGYTLHGLLQTWADKSGWTLIWKLDRDYNLEAGVVFRGTFTDVSSALVRSFARATPAPIGTFYQGNRVLLIGAQEDENAR